MPPKTSVEPNASLIEEHSEAAIKKKCKKQKGKDDGEKRQKRRLKRKLRAKAARKRSSLLFDEENTRSIKGSQQSIFRSRQGSIYTTQVSALTKMRDGFKAFEVLDDVRHEVTPKLVEISYLEDRFRQLQKRIIGLDIMKKPPRRSSTPAMRTSAARVGGLRVSMEDVVQGMQDDSIWEVGEQTGLLVAERTSIKPKKRHRCKVAPFLKVTLGKTPAFLLYMQQSTIVLRDTEEGQRVDADNRAYEYLTVGKGKIRRRSEAEAQTMPTLVKSRVANTDPIPKQSQASYVSSFEIYDTEKALAAAKERKKQPQGQSANIEIRELTEDLTDMALSHSTQRSLFMSDEAVEAMDTPEFQNVFMIMKRILSSNSYEEDQRRFRDMITQSALSSVFRIRYELHLLFRFHQQSMDKQRKAVTDMCFCPGNGDILAVAYGIYSFSAMHVPDSGYVCVWNIKNPDDPERGYYYERPASSVAFSTTLPNLLAVGLYNGNVMVHDISVTSSEPIAVSHRSTSPSCEPIVAIRWIKMDGVGGGENDAEPFLALSQDGSVTRYRIINSAYLLGYRQMLLERIEGNPDGIKVSHAYDLPQQANRHPQGLNLTLHPTMHDIYYVLTDEGCMHKCSINYPHQHLEVGQMHEASVNCMDFSPWSPKLFLTCGNDWCVRIWLDGIFKPLITLRYDTGPVHCAFWSRRLSSIIFAVNRKAIDVWDIRRSIMSPVTSVTLDTSYYTMAISTCSGTVIAIGNERGNVLMCALENFPLPPHYQFDELEKAIYKSIENNQELTDEVKMGGLVGYPNQAKVISV